MAWKVMISWEDGITDKCMPGRVAVFKDHMTNIIVSAKCCIENAASQKEAPLLTAVVFSFISPVPLRCAK